MTNEELLDLVGELAGEDPLNQDEMGGCVFCGGGPPGERYGYADRYLSDHDEDCPWVKARAALGDNLPAARPADEATDPTPLPGIST